MALSGTGYFDVTTELAPTTAWQPMRAPRSTATPLAIHAPSPIVVGVVMRWSAIERDSVPLPWSASRTEHDSATWVPAPISIRSEAAMTV